MSRFAGWRRLRARRAASDERGAVAVMTGVLMTVVLVAIAAFAVDLGTQRAARSDMQALADVVALDLGRLLTGRTADQIRAGNAKYPALSSALSSSLARNDDNTLGSGSGCGSSPCVTAYLVKLNADGSFPTSNGTPVEVAGGAVPDGVVVVAKTSVQFAFGLASSGGADRQAAATASSWACFRLGSFAAALNTNDSALAGVFESLFSDAFGVQMTTIGYQGLVSSYIDLGAIATQMGLGTVDALVAQGNVSVAGFLSATAKALSADGQTVAAAEVAKLAAKVDGALIMNVGDILAVGQGTAVTGRINTLDLLGAAGLSVASEVANHNNFLDTGVVWSDPWLSKGDVKVTVIEPPQQGCGPVGTTARTSQVRLDTNLGLELSGEKIDGLDLTTTDGTNKTIIQVVAELAGATGTLSGMRCGAGVAGDPEEIRVRVDGQAVSVDLGLQFHLGGEISTTGLLTNLQVASLANVLVSNIASATLTLSLDANVHVSVGTNAFTGTTDTVYSVPPRTYLDPEPSPGVGGPVAIPGVRTATITASVVPKLTVKLLGGLLPKTVNVPLTSIDLSGLTNDILYGNNRIGISLSNVTNNVNRALVPLSKLLGVQLGGADVFGVPRPQCGYPSLVR